ncbi:CPBP family intramembrane glutamic endopeptidase [Nocardia sp. NPDC127579]|uniref:CPBP family intramembrane glutamic endopeptidase n=1 Tax=Nocardia sp. NPDC127579 TaxID=3345402 RepID=UPI00363A837A
MSRPARIVAAVGVPLLWHNWLLPRLALRLRGRTAANAVFATGYALLFDGAPHWFSARGLRLGMLSVLPVAAGYAAAVAIPELRRGVLELADAEPEVPVAEWAGIHIPIGTVYSEELVFRGTLDPLLDKEFGPCAGTVLGAAAFGLWHIHPARAGADSVAGTVAVTALGGLVFGWLRRRTGSATAPALHHWALNAGGVLAARLARRCEAVGAAQ